MVEVAVISGQRTLSNPFATPRVDSAIRQLATELHDGLVQDLFASRLEVDELIAAHDLPPEAAERLQRLAGRLGESSDALRSVIYRLFHNGAGAVGGGSMLERITATVNDSVHRGTITTDLRVEGEGVEPGSAAADLMVRVVREGLANVVKHACASQALVVVRGVQAWWTIEIDDDGVGDPMEVRRTITHPAGLSFGVASLADEASRLGGRLSVGSAGRLGGIRLSVSVPAGRAC